MTATAQPSARVAAAAAPATQPAPSRGPEQRPPLRVVQPHERQPRRRDAADAKKRTRLIAVSGVFLAAVLLFGLVTAHVLLTQNQFRLQKVQRQAAEEQARYERLRAEVAELESPERVVAAAQERLGMVAPNSVKYLTPAGAVKAAPPAADAKSAGEEDEEQAGTDWSVVKRRLSSRP